MDEELPRGKLSEHKVDKDHVHTEKDVELCGALWDIEYKQLTVEDYVSVIEGIRDPIRRKLTVAKLVTITINGKEPGWSDMGPVLGLEIASFIDDKLEEGVPKN